MARIRERINNRRSNTNLKRRVRSCRTSLLYDLVHGNGAGLEYFRQFVQVVHRFVEQFLQETKTEPLKIGVHISTAIRYLFGVINYQVDHFVYLRNRCNVFDRSSRVPDVLDDDLGVGQGLKELQVNTFKSLEKQMVLMMENVILNISLHDVDRYSLCKKNLLTTLS